MGRSYDVVIVGGGAMGSAVAYFLAANPDFAGSILVVERDPTYAEAATSLSVGAIRQQFSTAENIEMSLYGAQFLADIGRHLGHDDAVPDISYVAGGYLFLATEAGRAILESNHRLQAALGAENIVLSGAKLAQRFPWLNTADLAAGSLGLRHEGWFDPYSLLQAFRGKAIALGAEYLKDEVVGFERRTGHILAVDLAREGRVRCGSLVNAAGPQAGAIAALAGIPLPVQPRKRYVYLVDCRAEVPCRELVVDPSGVYFRPEGRHFLCGRSPEEDEEPDCGHLDVDYDWFDAAIWPVLAHRVPAFEALKMLRGWAGFYDYNSFDQNAVLGPHPEIANFFFINGFSGHGIQQAPAAGRAVSELIAYGAYRSLDLRRFSYDRIAAGVPLKEISVV